MGRVVCSCRGGFLLLGGRRKIKRENRSSPTTPQLLLILLPYSFLVKRSGSPSKGLTRCCLPTKSFSLTRRPRKVTQKSNRHGHSEPIHLTPIPPNGREAKIPKRQNVLVAIIRQSVSKSSFLLVFPLKMARPPVRHTQAAWGSFSDEKAS